MNLHLNERDWKLKIIALLHDPVIKPFKLKDHEVIAKDIADKLKNIGNLKIEYDASLSWLIKCHHPKKAPECQKAERSLFSLKALIEADRNSSAADRVPIPTTEDIHIHEVYPIHPLSGERLHVLKIPEIDNSKVKEVKEDIIKFLTEKLSEDFLKDPKLLYLTLWRFLPEALEKGLESVSPTFINMNLPADTRVPTHTIWDHLRTTSALITCFKEEKLNLGFLRFEFGGVQEFLSKARTTADYWAGSWITSALMFSIIKEVSDNIGPDSIIYPDIHGMPLMDLWLCKRVKIGIGKPKDESILMPVIPEAVLIITPWEKVTPLSDRCKHALNKVWKALSSETKNRLKELLKERIHNWDKFDKTWDRQTSKPPFIFRITQVKWPGDINEARNWLNNMRKFEKEGVSVLTNDVMEFLVETWKASEKKGKDYVKPALLYSGLYEELQAKMHASGLIRHFKMLVEPSEGLRKRCNLCGIRNPVWDPDDHNFWDSLEQERLIDFNERLCSICLIKRVLGGTGSNKVKEMSKDVIEKFLENLCGEKIELKLIQAYPSTSDIATAEFKRSLLVLWEKLREYKLNEKLEDFLNAWKDYMKKVDECLGGEEQGFKDRWMPKRVSVPLLKKELINVDQNKKISDREKEILKQFTRLTGEYLFEETYERRFRRIKEKISEVRDEIKRELLRRKLSELEKSTLKVKETLKNFLSLYKNAVKKLEEKKELKGRVVLEPNDAFVILAMDGDSMGKWISGANNPTMRESIHEELLNRLSEEGEEVLKIRRAQSPANHAFISRTLSTYALKIVGRIIEEEFCGKLIYAGGDDIMALLPPEDAFEIAMRLREEYSREWGTISDRRGKSSIILGMGHKATSSISLVCAHYMYHFSKAIDESWRMLKDAKSYKKGWEKDAVCVALYSRAGEIARTTHPLHLLYPDPKEYPIFVNEGNWQGVSVLKNTNRLGLLVSSGKLGKGHKSPLIDALELSQLIKGKWKKFSVSRRMLYELIEEVELLKDLPANVVKAELKRLIRRHSKIEEKNGETLHRMFVDMLTNVLMYWYEQGCLKDLVMLTKISDSLLGNVMYG